jgi:hypothetical protein
MMARPDSSPPAQVAVYAGRICIGFVRRSAHGVEALTADERNIGIFRTETAAANALAAEHKGALA